MSNETPNTPGLSETELPDTKVDDLREQAKDAGISGTSSMKKEELVEAISEAARSGSGGGGGGAGQPGNRGPDQEVTSLDDDPERPGRSLATTSHEVIRQWAEARDGVPATVPGTEHGDHLGVLRIDFGGDNDDLRRVSWDEWFATFDARKLNFLYQEERKDGNQSTFFRLESPDREDG